MFGAWVRDRGELCIEPHAPRRAREMQRYRSCTPHGDLDVGQHGVEQKLGDFEQRQPSGCDLIQSLRAGARLDEHGPAAVVAEPAAMPAILAGIPKPIIAAAIAARPRITARCAFISTTAMAPRITTTGIAAAPVDNQPLLNGSLICFQVIVPSLKTMN